jgi:hypothetical protein
VMQAERRSIPSPKPCARPAPQRIAYTPHRPFCNIGRQQRWVQTSTDPYIVPRLSEGSTRSNGNTAVRRHEAAHGPKKSFPLPSGQEVKGHPSPIVTKPTLQTARLLYPNFRVRLRFSHNQREGARRRTTILCKAATTKTSPSAAFAIQLVPNL